MNHPENLNTPIFIHSLFRAGSTYLFNVFRRSERNYWCYQEPENEFLSHLNDDADELLKMGNDTVCGLRHPALNRPYFWEFYQVKDDLSGLFRKSFSYDDFFVEASSGLPEDQSRYFGLLISTAKGLPVFQFCRSAGRIGAIKRTFGGGHIHLWREPCNQWWSFKVNNYFDPAVQLIYNAHGLPPVLEEARRRCGIVEFHSDDIEEEFEHARRHPLGASTNYFVFYALWLYAYLEGEKYADITISIDRLSTDEVYRDAILQSLTLLGIDGLYFSDCSVPRAIFTEDEGEFFTKIEHQVQGLFLSHGYNKLHLDEATATREAILELREGVQPDPLRDAARAREMTLRYLDQHAQAEAHANAAEARANAAEARAHAAEAWLTDILNSKTWRLTAPLRWAIRRFRTLQSRLR